jgi:DNA-binding transcriptional LysR family regulator
LARLRAALGDPLLLRGKRGLVLTPRAQALMPVVTGAMGQLKGVFQPPSFDPAEANCLIRIASSDSQSILLGPPLVAHLIRQAPSVTLQMVPYIPDLALHLEDGSIDFAFPLASTPLPAGARSTPVADDRPRRADQLVTIRHAHATQLPPISPQIEPLTVPDSVELARPLKE